MKPGSRIDNRYILEKKLGAGNSGEVFLARDRIQQDCRVALKILHKNTLPSRAEEFSREFLTLSKFNHPNIARVYDFGITSEGRLYFSSEFIDGQDLLTFRKEHNQEEVLLEILVQICRGLEHIHSRGYIHYDIKPGNILVLEEKGVFRAKILDFSLAGKASNLVKGTLEYIAPEVIKGLPVDPRADFFSLGVTLYQTLIGRLPYKKTGKLEIFQSHLQNEQTPVQGTLSPPWQEVLIRLLDIEPSQRFQTANEIIQSLNKNFQKTFDLGTGSTKKSYLSSGQWIGRSKELGLLKTMAKEVFPRLNYSFYFQSLEDEILHSQEWDKIRNKRVCLISGRTGIGKSRLLKELKYFLQIHRVPLLFGSCKDYWERAYGPFEDILRQAAVLFPQFAQDSERLLAELDQSGQTWKDEEEGGEREVETSERWKFLEGMVQFFLDLAGAHPYVIFLEDLHLADEGTEALFEYLTRNLYISPNKLNYEEIISPSPFQSSLLLFTTFNEERAKEEVSEFLKGLSIEKETFVIPLQPMEKGEVRDLLCSMFNWKEVPPLLFEFILEVGEGNPLHTKELLLSLMEDGVLYPSKQGWAFQEKIPQRLGSLLEVLNRRLHKVEPDKMKLLEWFSVFNRPLSLSLLQEVSSFSLEALPPLLESLLESKILKKNLGEQGFLYVLSHPYYRRILYDGLSASRKKQLHRKVAGGLIRFLDHFPSISLEEIVHHLSLGKTTRKLTQYSLLAAMKNRDLHAHDRAAYYFEIALSQLSTPSIKGEKVAWELAKIYELKGNFQKAIPLLETLAGSTHKTRSIQAAKGLVRLFIHTKNFHRAEEFLTSLISEASSFSQEDQRELQNSLATLCITQGEVDRGIEISNHLASEMEGEEGIDESSQRAILFNNLGVAFLLKNEYKKAQDYFLQSLDIWKKKHNPHQSAKILVNLGNCSLYLGELREGAQYYKEALQTLMETGDLYHTANCLNNLGALYLWGGRFKKSLTYHLESYRIRRKIGSSQGIAMSLCNLGKAFSGLGKYTESLSLLQESLRLFEDLGDGEGRIVSRLCLCEIFTFLGDLSRGSELLQEAEEIGLGLQNSYYLARIWSQKGRIFYLEGHFEKAEEVFWKAFETLDHLKVRKEKNMCLLDLIELKIQQKDLIESKNLLKKLEIRPKEIFKDMVVRYHFLLGRLREEEGDLEGGSATMERALGMSEEMEDPAHELEAFYSLGHIFHRMGKYATAGKYYIRAMEKIKGIYMSLSVTQQKLFLRDLRRQKIKENMYSLKEEAENREKEILKDLEQTKKKSPRLFQDTPLSGKPLTSEEMDKIYLNPIHFRRIWEEHRLLLKFQEINRHINSDLHLSHLLPTIIKASIDLTGASKGYLIRKFRDSWNFEVAYEKGEGEIESPDLSDEEFLQKSFEEGKPELVKASSSRPSVLIVPLRARSHIIGLIYMKKKGPSSFSPRHMDILETFGKQAAISLENAFLVEKAKKVRKLLEDQEKK